MFDRLVHLYAKGGEPFRSLSCLCDDEALALMRSLYRPDAVYWDRFEDPAAYLQAQRAVENWLRAEFVAKGGRPQEPYPVYMVLGRSKWMEAAVNELTQATTSELEVSLVSRIRSRDENRRSRLRLDGFAWPVTSLT